MTDEGRVYPLQRSPEETRRLILQQRVIGEGTARLLRAAGVGPGARVLDIGSGAGDVALTAARLVGAQGSVLGVDIDAATVAGANERARREGVGNVRFEVADVVADELPTGFHFAVGRLVLMHVSDPVAVLARAASLLTPGGGIAFEEPELTVPWTSYPDSPSLRAAEDVRLRALELGQRVDPHIGLALPGVFAAAGLPSPHLQPSAVLAGADDGAELFAATIASLHAGWVSRGVPGADALEVDGLAGRIRAEIGDHGTVRMFPLVGAWARLPVG